MRGHQLCWDTAHRIPKIYPAGASYKFESSLDKFFIRTSSVSPKQSHLHHSYHPFSKPNPHSQSAKMGWFDSGSDEAQAHDQVRHPPTPASHSSTHNLISSAPKTPASLTTNTLQLQNPERQASLTHEGLGAAAAFMAAHEYEQYCEKNGKPQSHAQAKEVLAGLAGAIIDREFETKGLDFIDKEKAKRAANKRLHEQAGNDY